MLDSWNAEGVLRVEYKELDQPERCLSQTILCVWGQNCLEEWTLAWWQSASPMCLSCRVGECGQLRILGMSFPTDSQVTQDTGEMIPFSWADPWLVLKHWLAQLFLCPSFKRSSLVLLFLLLSVYFESSSSYRKLRAGLGKATRKGRSSPSARFTHPFLHFACLRHFHLCLCLCVCELLVWHRARSGHQEELAQP